MCPTQLDETIPGRVLSFWTHQQGLSRTFLNKNIFLDTKKILAGLTQAVLLLFHLQPKQSPCFYPALYFYPPDP